MDSPKQRMSSLETPKCSGLRWTAIVVTCASEKLRGEVEEECQRVSSGGLLPDHDLLVVLPDPEQHQEDGPGPGPESGTGVGSGGATINAVFVAIERLSALHNYTTVSSELVHSSRILVVHLGRTLVHSPGGAAFLRISPQMTSVPPYAQVTPPTLLQHAFWTATRLSENTPSGVWVTSLDTFIPWSEAVPPVPVPGGGGAVLCSVPAPLALAAQHGVVVRGDQQHIKNLVYRMPMEKLKETFRGGVAEVISGAVYLGPSLTETLLGLHTVAPLDRCTYYGTDSGIPALQVSLYFDLLLPLCCEVNQEEYISGQCGASYTQAVQYSAISQLESRLARLQIWNKLQGFKAFVHPLGNMEHHYLQMNLPYKDSILPLLPSTSFSHSSQRADSGSDRVITVNTVMEGGVKTCDHKIYIFDSWFGKNVSFSSAGTSVLQGFQLKDCSASLDLAGGCVWQLHVGAKEEVVTCHGWTDHLVQPHQEPEATIFNTTWSVFLAKTGIVKEDLWLGEECQFQNFLSAKIFVPELPTVEQFSMISALVRAATDDHSQNEWNSKMQKWKQCHRISLVEAALNCDVKKIIRRQENIFLESIKNHLRETAEDVGGISLLPLFQYIVKREVGPVKEVLHTLHTMLYCPRPSTPRLLSNIADLLGCLAQGRGGLRSGPADNPQWKQALLELKAGRQREAVEQMQAVCEQWINSSRPENLIRAARHYERAVQIIISQQVETAGVHVSPMWVSPEVRHGVGLGVWVEAHAPARLDLAGGWTDTPPICYEQGGAVLNIAIKINKTKPIGARIRYIPEPHIVCVLRDCSGGDMRLTWTELEHLQDYNNPVSPGALVKATLLYCRLVDLSLTDSLSTQLKDKYGGGVEVEVWSHLPQGSGLGGSSILVGTLLSATVVLLGHPPPRHTHLVHATLCVEQWLTTGGGWQDQVGGLIGGVKLSVSRKGTPLSVSTYQIPLSQLFLDALNSHLLLIYTDKVRLARNLLQTVIRNWYACDPTVTLCFSELQQLALQAAGAVLDNNLEQLGTCIMDYWKLKKMVASGCEPSVVTKLMAALQGHCLGMSLAGAGGGGYFFALKTRSEPLGDKVSLEGLVCDRVEVDQQGLEVWVGGESVPQPNEDDEVLTHAVWKKLQQECQ